MQFRTREYKPDIRLIENVTYGPIHTTSPRTDLKYGHGWQTAISVLIVLADSFSSYLVVLPVGGSHWAI